MQNALSKCSLNATKYLNLIKKLMLYILEIIPKFYANDNFFGNVAKFVQSPSQYLVRILKISIVIVLYSSLSQDAKLTSLVEPHYETYFFNANCRKIL